MEKSSLALVVERPLEPQAETSALLQISISTLASRRRIKEQTLAAVKQHNDPVSRVIVEEGKKQHETSRLDR
jgi:hypothetical protein